MEGFEGHIKVASHPCGSNAFTRLCGLAKTEVQALNKETLLEIKRKAGCRINPTAQKQPSSLLTWYLWFSVLYQRGTPQFVSSF